MSEDFYARLLDYLNGFKAWHDWQNTKEGEKPPLPGSIRILLHECYFNKYGFTEEQADRLLGFSDVMLYSFRPFVDFVTILAYCGVKGSLDMETAIDVDTYMLRETVSRPGEIAARCLHAAGVFKKGEVPLYYDYGAIGFQVPSSFRGFFLLLTNYRAFAIGGVFHKEEKFHKIIYDYPESYLRSLDYIWLDKRLAKIGKDILSARALAYTKFHMTHVDKHTIFIPFVGTFKKSEKGFDHDWLTIFFSPLDMRSLMDNKKKDFDEIKKKFRQSDVLTEFPYSKKSIGKDDRKRRVAVLQKKLEEIHNPIKDTTVAWHVDA